MHDQAAQLRHLVFRSIRQTKAESTQTPRIMVVCGGRAGVGTTTLAMNLSVSLASNGSRVVLVDGDQTHQGVAELTGISPVATDWLNRHQDIHEVLQLGPAGIQQVSPIWPVEASSEYKLKNLALLSKQFRKLYRHTDLVVVDAGHVQGDVMASFWYDSTDVLLVTTPDPVAVMDTYALTKSVVSRGIESTTGVVVNRASSDQVSYDVQVRLKQSCKRFLDHELIGYGHIDEDDQIATSQCTHVPYVQQWPGETASRQFQKLASRILAVSDTGSDTKRAVA